MLYICRYELCRSCFCSGRNSGGFASVDIRQIIRYIGVELDVKAMDVVDFTPSYDPGHITAQLVESIMRDSVAAFAKRKANKNGGKNNA